MKDKKWNSANILFTQKGLSKQNLSFYRFVGSKRSQSKCLAEPFLCPQHLLLHQHLPHHHHTTFFTTTTPLSSPPSPPQHLLRHHTTFFTTTTTTPPSLPPPHHLLHHHPPPYRHINFLTPPSSEQKKKENWEVLRYLIAIINLFPQFFKDNVGF